MEAWLFYALGAATFCALTTVLAKIGLRNVDPHLAVAIRTVTVLAFAWIMVFIVGSGSEIFSADIRTLAFLILSGLASGGAWLCFFKALKLGDVNKVVPIDKSSTILTMLLAFIFLGEPVGPVMVMGMLLMGSGTWLMLDMKKATESDKARSRAWIIFAFMSAVFASLTAIFGRIGIENIEPTLGTAIRTVAVVPMSWLMVYITKGQNKIRAIDKKSWVFLVFSGIAVGSSWLLFYRALQVGSASLVVPIDKLSIVIVMGFARLFLGETFSKRSLIGLALLTIGTLLPVVFY